MTLPPFPPLPLPETDQFLYFDLEPPKIAFLTREGITGTTDSFTCARCPNAYWLTTEYSMLRTNFTGSFPTLVVFETKSPTGTFHLLRSEEHTSELQSPD